MQNVITIRDLLRHLKGEAWKRFFIAIGGLALAFAVVLYSTVFKQEGNEVMAAATASFALLLAGGVGLYTVPFLAKRVALETVKEAFDYDLTKEGMIYLGIALLIGVAALNTGNNLLYIVIAAMLSAVLVS